MRLIALLKKMFTYHMTADIGGIPYHISQVEFHTYQVSSAFHSYTIHWDERQQCFVCDNYIQESIFNQLTEFIDDYF